MFLVFCAEYGNVLIYGFVCVVSAVLFWLRGLKIVFSLTQTFPTCLSYLQLKQTSFALSPFITSRPVSSFSIEFVIIFPQMCDAWL